VGIPVIDVGAMTVDEFYAFTDTRPDREKWELIDGEPILNAAASRIHQRITRNISGTLFNIQRQGAPSWEVLADFGVRVSDKSRPEPDILLLPRSTSTERHTVDPIVAFEVLSASTKANDLTTKLKAYTSLPSLTHYVVIAQDTVEVTVYARDDGFRGRALRSHDDVVDLGSLNVSMTVAEIYWDSGV